MKKRWILAGSVVCLTLSVAGPATAQTPLDDMGDVFSEPKEEGKPEDESSTAAPTDDPAAEGTSDDPGVSAEGEAGGDQGMSAEQYLARELPAAKALADAGRTAEAINKYLDINRTLAGASGAAAVELARLYEKVGEDALALEAYAEVLSGDTQNYPTAIAESTEIQLRLRRFVEAEENLQQGIRTAPTDPKLLFLRGKALISVFRSSQDSGGQDRDYVRDAISSLDRAIAIDDKMIDAYAERAIARSLTRDYEKAIADIEKAVALDPKNSNNQAKRAFLLAQRAGDELSRYDADRDQAIKDYREAIAAFDAYLATEGNKTKDDYDPDDFETIRPDYARWQKAIAQIALAGELNPPEQTELYQSAIQECDAALEFNPESIDPLLQRAVAERVLGQNEKAIDTLTDILKSNPNTAEVLLRRGIVWLAEGEVMRARVDFQRAQQSQQGSDPRAKFWLGVTYAKEGEYPQAVRFYSEALRANPDYKPAYNNRGLAYLQMGEFSRAEEDFEELLVRNRNDNVARQRRDLARQRQASSRRQ